MKTIQEWHQTREKLTQAKVYQPKSVRRVMAIAVAVDSSDHLQLWFFIELVFENPMSLHHIVVQYWSIWAVCLVECLVDFVADEGKRVLLVISSKNTIYHDLLEDYFTTFIWTFLDVYLHFLDDFVPLLAYDQFVLFFISLENIDIF